MSKKAFTLIELLSVIIILAIIIVIAIPNVLKVLDSSKTEVYNKQVRFLEQAAELYINNKIFNNQTVENYITLQSLVDSKLISGIPKDSRNQGNLNGVIKVEKVNGIYIHEYLEVNNNSGEIVLIDPSKELSKIIIEGNSEQVVTTTDKNLFNPKVLLYAFNLPTQIVDGIECYRFQGYTNRDIEPVFFKAGTYTLVTRAKRVFGTDGTGYSQYWGFDLATRSMSYPTAVIKSRLVENVVNLDWFTNIMTFTIPQDTWIDRIHEYSYGTAERGYYYIDKNSMALYYGSYTLSTLPQYESFIPNSPTPQYQSNIVSVGDGNVLKIIYNGPKNITLTQPLRKLSDTIKDRLVVDYVSNTTKIEKNVGQYIFNGTESWYSQRSTTGGNNYYNDISNTYYTSVTGNVTDLNKLYMSNKFLQTSYAIWPENNTVQGMSAGTGDTRLFVRINNNLTGVLSTDDVTIVANKFKTWLASNPTTVLYQLSTPVTETITHTSVIDNVDYQYIYFDSNIKGNIIVEYQ